MYVSGDDHNGVDDWRANDDAGAVVLWLKSLTQVLCGRAAAVSPRDEMRSKNAIADWGSIRLSRVSHTLQRSIPAKVSTVHAYWVLVAFIFMLRQIASFRFQK